MSLGNRGDVKNDGVVCARAQKVVNMSVTQEEGKPELNPWWTARAGIVLMEFVPPVMRRRLYSHGTLWDECHK